MDSKREGEGTAVDGDLQRTTRSLVQLYESGQSTKTTKPQTESVRYVGKPSRTITKPEAPRSTGVITSPASVRQPPSGDASTNVGSNPRETKSGDTAVVAAVKSASLQPAQPAESSRKAPLPPPPRRSQRPLDGAIDAQNGAGKRAVGKSDNYVPSLPIPLASTKPSAPPANRPALPKRPSQRPDTTLLDPAPSSKAPRSPSIPSPSRNGFGKGQHSPSFTPQLSVDSLANAMVASSLASSRASSPARPRPALAQPESSKSRLLLSGDYLSRSHSSNDVSTRTPSPEKRMRQTMRSPPKDETEVIEHGRNRLGRHPNKHHEADRKRYRTQVTERERKRYEGVWAANRGILIASSPNDAEHVPGDGEVLNLVVREIWRRSRLPDDVLEEVWDLVDIRGRDRLGREEFVVGMWLIDQRLKGNKLPVKVPESIWSSVRRLSGIKVPRPR